MIQIRIPFILKDNSIIAIIHEYQKRIKLKFDIRSSDKLLYNISNFDYLISMSPEGKNFSSKEFAELISNKLMSYKNIIFFIGSAKGLDKSIIQKSNELISFGKNTWPHQLCTAMLVEQIYRAEQIINNHPYDK